MSVQPGKTTVVNVPQEEINLRRELFAMARSGQRPPRWPVSVKCSDLHYAEIHGISNAQYLNDPISHAEAQIAGQKWVLENLQTDDCHISACPLLTARPSAFGAEIVAQPSGRIWFKPWIKNSADLEKLIKIDPNTTGTSAVYNQWCNLYEEEAEKYPVRFEGGEIFYPLAGQTGALTTGIQDPFSLAADLMGIDNLLKRLDDDSPFVEDLLDILTDKIIDTVCANRLAENYDGSIFVSCSWTHRLDRDQYQCVALPSLLRIRDTLNRPVVLYQTNLPAEHLPSVLGILEPTTIAGFRYKDHHLDHMAQLAHIADKNCYLQPVIDGNDLMACNEHEIFSRALQTLMIFDPHENFHLSVLAADAMPLAVLPRLGSAHTASHYMQKQE